MNRRVVVTGLGAITPIGNNVPEFWSAVKQRMHTVWVLPSVPESEVYRQSKESIANYWKRDREE